MIDPHSTRKGRCCCCVARSMARKSVAANCTAAETAAAALNLLRIISLLTMSCDFVLFTRRFQTFDGVADWQIGKRIFIVEFHKNFAVWAKSSFVSVLKKNKFPKSEHAFTYRGRPTNNTRTTSHHLPQPLLYHKHRPSLPSFMWTSKSEPSVDSARIDRHTLAQSLTIQSINKGVIGTR